MRALATDLYQLTMAAGYFHRGMSGDLATCEAFVRRLPRRRRYLVAMGIEALLDYLEELRFTEEDIAYMRTVPGLADAMTPDFAAYLRAFRFTGDVWAVPEGTVVFAHEPMVRVTAPLIEAQIVETWLLSTLNHATMIASKAARIVRAAGRARAIEFGTRRTHPEAAVGAARAAYAVGFEGTSNVEAGRRHGIPVVGTAAHMWTMAHETEEAAFESYVKVFPSACILLIDTYDTVRGAERAVKAAREKLRGVRLDSGDLGELSRSVRAVLDAGGCASAKIVASGDLNEYLVADLVRSGAPIDIYGIGTELVCSVDAPSLGGVYKLVELRRGGRATPIAKFSKDKVTFPGIHQVLRFRDPAGRFAGDVLALDDEPPETLALPGGSGAGHAAASAAGLVAGTGEPLLVPRVRGGRRIGPREALDAIRARAGRELAALPDELHLLEEGPAPAPTPSARLVSLTDEVRARVGGLAGSPP